MKSDKSDKPTRFFPDEIEPGTKEAMLFCLEQSNGIVSMAVKNANISRDTHYRWMKEDADYEVAVKMAKELAIDFVESKLFTLINGVTTTTKDGKKVYKRPPCKSSIRYYLSTQAKHRGYVQRQEVVNTDVVIEIEGRTINVKPNEG